MLNEDKKQGINLFANIKAIIKQDVGGLLLIITSSTLF